VNKEIKGNYLLKHAGIPTSKILYSKFCKELKSHILIFEFIERSATFEKIFESDKNPESDNLQTSRKKYLIFLVRLMAKIHQKGLIHTDLHPDNFLLKKETIYALDGASIRQVSAAKPLKKETCLKNLAVIFSQINFVDSSLLYDLATVYAEERKYNRADQTARRLEIFIRKSHESRTAKYLKKIHRRSTQIVCKKSFSSFLLCQRRYYTSAMESFLQNPDMAFHNPGTLLLKAGNTATIALYKIDGKQLVVKRYNMKNRFHAFRMSFKTTRADISWRSAHLLLKNRINTPKPVAVKKIRFGPLRNRSFFIYEYIKGKNARQFFLDTKADEAETVAESIINLFYKLKSLKISHGDMKATNIIIHDNKPFFIDLDSMKWHKRELMFSHAWKKDMKRFMKNWDNRPEVAGLFKKLQN